MPVYLSPGVYVEEIPSGSAPIAGAGTSTAAIIGTINAELWIVREVGSKDKPIEIGVGTGDGGTYELAGYPVVEASETYGFWKNVSENAGTITLKNDPTKGTASVTFEPAIEKGAKITGYYQIKGPKDCEIKLCTNFGEFKQFFGDFSTIDGQNTLAHAVYGFFRNGGTRCYVTWIKSKDSITKVLESLEAIDEISIVVAPGNKDIRADITDHCKKMGDRIAILDGSEEVTEIKSDNLKLGFTSDYAALYFPWIQVYDPASQGNIFVPPSGHIAGVYARVDGQRGVHKAPANEPILGALDLKYNLSKEKQDGLNPYGINCIRRLNGNILVWGARTLGGDANTEFKYVNIRRYFLYLRDSINQGTQWTVFEPNTPELWAKIRRNISAFLLLEWRKGALFGTTPEKAFFVKCDEENNPPEIRERGQVVTEIGVAVVQPAEFVIFRISQWTAK